MGDGADWILVKGSGGLGEEAQVIMVEMNGGLGWGSGWAAGSALLNMFDQQFDLGPKAIDRFRGR